LWRGSCVSIYHNVTRVEAHLPTKWHLDPSSRLVTTHGPKIGGFTPLGGGAGSPSNTMWPGPRPTSVPDGILIHPTVWPQYTNVTDRQTGQTGQRSDSIRRTVLQTVPNQRMLMLYFTIRFKNKRHVIA